MPATFVILVSLKITSHYELYVKNASTDKSSNFRAWQYLSRLLNFCILMRLGYSALVPMVDLLFPVGVPFWEDLKIEACC